VDLFRPSLGFLVEAQSRLENRRGQKALFGRGAHNFFRVRLGKNFEIHEILRLSLTDVKLGVLKNL
jgi:hypothetical protein